MIHFKKNKYTKIYYQLIEKRKTNPLLKENVYCEKHHIIPRSCGGSNFPDNLVNLLPREHFVAHLLLTKMVEKENDLIKMSWALHKMVYGKNADYFNGKDYEWYRKKHIKFLKENHPSKKEEWRRRVSERVLKDWENNNERRKKTGEILNQWRLENPEQALKNQRKAAKLGAEASRLVISKKLEYNNKTYIGWNELYEKTGVSKFLYNKFYLKGIDPSFRIGKDGPVSEKELEKLIEMFCDKNHLKVPKDKKEFEKIIDRMYNVGLLTSNEKTRLSRKESQ